MSFQSVPAKGVSFVVSSHVFVGSGRCADRVDAGPHVQTHHRGFRTANFLDGDWQGPKDRLGAAIAGPLPGTSCGCNDADPDHRAKILVCRSDRLRHSHYGRPRQGILLVDIWRDAGESSSMVLDADRGRPGPASPDWVRPVDFHGGEWLILPACASASRINTLRWCGPTPRSTGVQPSPS